MFSSVQSTGCVLWHVGFAVPGGDWHVIKDVIDGPTPIGSLRVSFEIRHGPHAQIRVGSRVTHVGESFDLGEVVTVEDDGVMLGIRAAVGAAGSRRPTGRIRREADLLRVDLGAMAEAHAGGALWLAGPGMPLAFSPVASRGNPVEPVRRGGVASMAMSLRIRSVVFDAAEPDVLARFWASLLGREVLDGALVPGEDTQCGLRFAATDLAKSGPNPVHLHLTSSSLEDQRDTVQAALRLGAHHLHVGQQPEDGHVVLGDPEGNEFCVIEPGNGYLAGCGPLGEVTCEGSRVVGGFWREALGWPFVWDQGDQTAIQSPDGGTKISWDVRPGNPVYGARRQRLEALATEPALDLARLVALGATELGQQSSRVVMADPDGREFWISRV